MPFILLLSLIIFHELGHFLCAKISNVEVDKIYIYPFGGISKFNLCLNESIFKEFLILIMGPLTQLIYYLLIIRIDYFSNYIELLTAYNYTILFFNLLPIYPLDGGKLLNLLLMINFPFKKSLYYSIYISYIVIFIYACINIYRDLSISLVVIISFLIYKVSSEYKNINYLFDKFLLERYLNNYDYLKRKRVNRIDDFRRNKYHYIKNNGKYYTEKTFLHNKFNNKY